MATRSICAHCTFALLSSLAAFAARADVLAESRFELDSNGWHLDGDPSTFIPQWLESAGNPGGCAKATDNAEGVLVWWAAPPSFLGEKTGAYGGTLEFDMQRSNAAAWDFADVRLYGANSVLVIDAGPNPAVGTWTHFEVSLLETGGWRLDSLAGAAPSAEQFRAVLADLHSLQIRGEFSDGADSSWLDNVVLTGDAPCHIDGDVNNDGVVNLSDLGFVLANFLLSCP